MNTTRLLPLCFALFSPVLVAQTPSGASVRPAPRWAPEQGAASWVAVGEGTALEAQDGGLDIRYPRTAGTAFGAAFPIENGLSANFGRLRLDLEAPTGAMLLISLRGDDGAVHSWSMRPGRKGEPLELDLSAGDLGWDRFQNAGRAERPFAPKRVRALSVTDISGFMGGRAEEVVLTVRAMSFGGADADPQHYPAKLSSAAGERVLFEALVGGEGSVEEAIAALRLEVLQQPERARSQLLLGLSHLWRAAEGDRNDPTHLDDALLADVWFSRAAALDPQEDRIPSWQVPTRLTLANLLDQRDRIAALRAELRAAAERDVGFHGFALALTAWTGDPDAAPFQEGLQALRQTIADSVEGAEDPSVVNKPWWPHNREGFLLFAADYEHRAGNGDRARELLDAIERVPDVASWPFRDLIGQRREAWQRGESGVAPDRPWLEGQSCVVCHRAR